MDRSFQDMSVHDKPNPALEPTEEAQDMSTLARVVVPVGAFTDPNNPAGASASVNMALDESPFQHSEDYGRGVLPAAHVVTGPEDTHAKEVGSMFEWGEEADEHEYPEDRGEWMKADWVAKAESYELAKSGNTDAVKKRVEEFEGQLEVAKEMNAEEWKGDIESAETVEELSDLQKLYRLSGADYSTVVAAFDERHAALTNEQ